LMEAPEEVKKLAEQIFGKDVKLKITGNNIIQAEWWPLLAFFAEYWYLSYALYFL